MKSKIKIFEENGEREYKRGISEICKFRPILVNDFNVTAPILLMILSRLESIDLKLAELVKPSR